jgi:hypothetical protein
VGERIKPLLSKSSVAQAPVGSNPTLSANHFILRGTMLKLAIIIFWGIIAIACIAKVIHSLLTAPEHVTSRNKPAKPFNEPWELWINKQARFLTATPDDVHSLIMNLYWLNKNIPAENVNRKRILIQDMSILLEMDEAYPALLKDTKIMQVRNDCIATIDGRIETLKAAVEKNNFTKIETLGEIIIGNAK